MSDQTTSYPSAQRPADAGAPVPRSRRGLVAGIVVATILLVALVALGIVTARTNRRSAAVGDCVRRSGGDAVAIVPCDDPQAEFEVLGRVEDQTEIEAGISTCTPFADLGATQIYWEGEQGGTGFVLCLAEHGA